MTVSGIDSALVGIDVRPADEKLYGLSAGGTTLHNRNRRQRDDEV